MFGGDPFGNPFQQMHRHMRDMDNMMNAMMQDSLGMMMGVDPRQRRQPQQMIQQRHPQHPMMNDMMLSPFGGGFGGGLFGGGLLGGMMQQMENMQHHAMNDPNSTVFTQSTMISFDGNGAPKVVHDSTRKTGDVKETRHKVQHGQELEEMSVGHSIGDRTHVIEKKRDKDGRLRQNQKFINLEAEAAEEFNNEFKSRATRNLEKSGLADIFIGIGPNARDQQRAIGPSVEAGHSRGNGGRSAPKKSNGGRLGNRSGDNAPIVTIPDDDDEEVEEDVGHRRNGHSHRHNDYRANERSYTTSGRTTGPTIREISEEEADMEVSKRRKGLFGKFL